MDFIRDIPHAVPTPWAGFPISNFMSRFIDEVPSSGMPNTRTVDQHDQL